jgi:hypothetical protein
MDGAVDEAPSFGILIDSAFMVGEIALFSGDDNRELCGAPTGFCDTLCGLMIGRDSGAGAGPVADAGLLAGGWPEAGDGCACSPGAGC